MSDVKRCKQCGILKDAEQFRPYTYSRNNETGGRFSICRSCESINSRYKKAKEVVEGTVGEKEQNRSNYVQAKKDVEIIEELFTTLESHGFHTPLSRGVKEAQQTVADKAIADLSSFYGGPKPPEKKLQVPTELSPDVPNELTHWLETGSEQWKEQGFSPEFLQETIYESLKAKYRPQIGMDQEKFIPVYDDTYKAVLHDILRKFDDYEEEMSEVSDDA